MSGSGGSKSCHRASTGTLPRAARSLRDLRSTEGRASALRRTRRSRGSRSSTVSFMTGSSGTGIPRPPLRAQSSTAACSTITDGWPRTEITAITSISRMWPGLSASRTRTSSGAHSRISSRPTGRIIPTIFRLTRTLSLPRLMADFLSGGHRLQTICQ